MNRDDQPIRNLCKISRLPWKVRLPLNEMLRDNRKLAVIAQWLWEQMVEADLPELDLKKGERYANLFAHLGDPETGTRRDLSTYHCGATFRQWLEEEKRNDRLGSIVANLNAAAAIGNEAKKNVGGVGGIALSLILIKLEKLAGAETVSVDELRKLTQSIATLNNVQVAAEKSAIDQRKLALIEKEFESAQTATQRPQLTPEEKQRRYKEIFGIQ